jgi:hypothetical protein
MKKLLYFIFFLVSAFSKAQLTIYSNYNLQGTSATCIARTIYTDNNIPNGLNDAIKSISLNQGYMATVAENADGSGERFTYMANTSNINVNLALVLQNKISFIRVLKLPTTVVKKKGACNTSNAAVADLNVTWFYDWGSLDYSTPTREFVPMAWGVNGASDANINAVIAKDSLTHYLAFNEPDNNNQSNISVVNAVPLYKKILRAGQRMGSPACTESEYKIWLDSFTNVANQQSLKIDFVCVHWYDWGNWLSTLNTNPSATDVFNRFKDYINAVYDLYKKPIWITEFNANPNRISSVQQGFMNLALPWLDSDSRIERYAFFFGNDVPMYNTNGTLSTVGTTYANHTSVNAYTENIIDTRPAFPITLATWEPSTLIQGGYNVANFLPNTLNVNITAPSGLTRGSGVSLPGTTVSNGYWGGTNFSTTDAQAGINANKFVKFSLKSKNAKSVNYHAIDKFNIRINNIGPIQYQIDYQLDNGLFSPIATITGPTRTTGNYLLGPIDLSKIAGLQNVPSSSTITFRITPFDASGNGTFLIGSGVNDTIPDLTIIGGYSDDNIISPPLPITLTKFQLQRNNNKVLLSWETKSEINFSRFELERGEDVNHFNTIATINGLGSQNENKYYYTDENAAAVTNYYRLKLLDKDGNFKYSNILTDKNSVSIKSLSVYPTVTTGSNIKASFEQVSQKSQLKIFNNIGQLITTYNLQEGAHTHTFETAQLAQGTYFIVLQNNNTVQSRIFIKQ